MVPALPRPLLGLVAACGLLTVTAATPAEPAATPAPPPGMALVPAGPVTVGCEAKAIDEDAAEKPPHAVDLPAFYIDTTEVTTAQFCQFLNAAKATRDTAGHAWLGPASYLPIEERDGQWRPKPGQESFPMAAVTWYGAHAYAEWAGKRLPTEAEWEKAARGTDGRKYPWGNDMDHSRMRFGQDSHGPVGGFPTGASPCGCLDMAGSVWEWTSTLFRPYPYVGTDGREDAAAAGPRVARGGSWTGEPHIAHASYRFRPEPTFAHGYLGFRCARSAP